MTQDIPGAATTSYEVRRGFFFHWHQDWLVDFATKNQAVLPKQVQEEFSQAKSALFRKAAALSEFEGTEVAVIIFSPSGTLSQFSNCAELDKLLTRYSKNCQLTHETVRPGQVIQMHVHVLLLVYIYLTRFASRCFGTTWCRERDEGLLVMTGPLKQMDVVRLSRV